MTVVRQWLGLPVEPDPQREEAKRRLDDAEKRLRLARVDAGMPSARWHQVYPHPHRRSGD